MNKYPFTSEGIDRLISYLYTLSPAELNQVIQQLLTNYISWIANYIELTPKQLEQLNALPASFLFSNQQQLALALQLRLPIRLDKQEAPASRPSGQEGVGKLHGVIFSIEAPQDEPVEEQDAISETGELVYRIWYEKTT